MKEMVNNFTVYDYSLYRFQEEVRVQSLRYIIICTLCATKNNLQQLVIFRYKKIVFYLQERLGSRCAGFERDGQDGEDDDLYGSSTRVPVGTRDTVLKRRGLNAVKRKISFPRSPSLPCNKDQSYHTVPQKVKDKRKIMTCMTVPPMHQLAV
jgi:hypothetical protein